jgi:hypothetical protein
VYTGDCSTFEGLNLVAQNDNGCGEGLLTSSLDSIEVTAGETYYIEWIDRWMSGPTDELYIWELGFDAFVGVKHDAALKQRFTAFPNPVSEVLNVRFESGQATTDMQVSLLNMLGQSLMDRQLGKGEMNVQIPVHNLPAGTYQLRVMLGSRQATQTVLIK